MLGYKLWDLAPGLAGDEEEGDAQLAQPGLDLPQTLEHEAVVADGRLEESRHQAEDHTERHLSLQSQLLAKRSAQLSATRWSRLIQ